jgi:class 3 adenylate cyclase
MASGPAVREAGEGLAVICLHCSASSGGQWRALMDRLAPAVAMAAMNMVGRQGGGIAVHIGARVAALAAPNEVLVSSTVRDLVAGSGLTFRDRGPQTAAGRAGGMAAVRGGPLGERSIPVVRF